MPGIQAMTEPIYDDNVRTKFWVSHKEVTITATFQDVSCTVTYPTVKDGIGKQIQRLLNTMPRVITDCSNEILVIKAGQELDSDLKDLLDE